MTSAFEAYMATEDAVSADASLAALMENEARPLIRRVVTARLAGRWNDLDDVCADAGLELLLRLRRARSGTPEAAIRDFAAYVAAVAVNACNRYFRRRRPGRARLKRQIRIVLEDDPDFTLSTGRDGRARGALTDGPRATPANPDLSTLAAKVEPQRDLGALLRRIFAEAGGEVEIDALVDIVARIWGIGDESASVPENALEAIPAESGSPEVSIDNRRFLLRLWGEIRLLPRDQRVALLLHLRDHGGSSVLFLLPVAGIASFGGLAAVLGVSEEELSRMWNDLPLDDLSVAAMLRCARQRVINLRMAARKRLGNRLGRWRQ